MKFPYTLAILKKVDAESLGPPPKFQVNIEIQLNTARVSRLSFRFLWLWYKYTIALIWNLASALILALHWYCGDNVKYGLFQNTCFKENDNMAGEKIHSNDKLFEKIMSFSYHMEQKTFIEPNCIFNIHTGEKKISCYFWRFVSRLNSDKLRNLKCTLVCTSRLLLS